jgi:hypothetical protein
MAGGGLPRDADLDIFVERFLVSFAAWDLLVLLRMQPDLAESTGQLAYRLGRSENEIASALGPMLAGGLVQNEEIGGETAYRLREGAVEELRRFGDATNDREWRLELVRRVLSRMG